MGQMKTSYLVFKNQFYQLIYLGLASIITDINIMVNF